MQENNNKNFKKVTVDTSSSEVKLKGGKLGVSLEKPTVNKIKKTQSGTQEYKKSIRLPKDEEETKKEEIPKAEPIIQKKAPALTKPLDDKEEKALKDKIKQQKKEERKIKRRENKERRLEKKANSTISPKIYKGLCVALAIVSVFLIVATVFVYRPEINSKGIPSVVTVKYEFSKSTRNLSGSYVFPNGKDQVYINLTEISEYLNLMILGDSEGIKFYKSNGDYMSVKNNSPYVVINGVDIILPSPVIFSGKSVFVPAELFNNYTTGLSVDYNIHRERLTLSFVKDETKSSTINTVYLEFNFIPRLPVSIDPIPEPNA